MRDRIADTLRVLAYGEALAPWEYLREPAKEPWRKKADILLGVMSEPTEAMVSAGVDAETKTPPTYGMDTCVKRIWVAMLKKAKGA